MHLLGAQKKSEVAKTKKKQQQKMGLGARKILDIIPRRYPVLEIL